MNYRRLGITLIIVISTASVKSQNSLDDVLHSIKQNNKTILSIAQYVVASNLENRTGLTLKNPSVSTDYMIGRPASGGNQVDLLAVQGFDFPTSYGKKKQLAAQQEKLLNLEKERTIQDILLEAKLVVLELIYLNQQKSILEKRKRSAADILTNYQYKFDLDQISALDLNKAKIQLLNVKTSLRTTESKITLITHHLTELNGGIPLSILDETYPISAAVPEFESINDTIEAHDPDLKWLVQKNATFRAQIDVRKAMALPSFELGYHYQSVLGQQFSGVHLGFTIPLWESKNTVKASVANAQFGEVKIEEHKLRHHFEIKELYQDYELLKLTREDYKTALDGINSAELLTKLLELGEINFISYSLELHYYYNTLDQYAVLNLAYQKVVAELYKYQL
ncbi:MAG: cobalt-zinc-cadmium efflux system outer membrane protein [Flavobacteriaceae bacterium]|jgi:cobalt-zinc-cadmium efflux system outer membrane protein